MYYISVPVNLGYWKSVPWEWHWKEVPTRSVPMALISPISVSLALIFSAFTFRSDQYIYCLWYWVLSTNYSVFRPFGVTVKWTDSLTLLQKCLLTQDTKLKHSIWIGFHLARAKATLDQAQTRISTLQGRVVLVTSPLSNGSPQLIVQTALQNRISAIGTGIGCIRLLLPQNVTGIKGEFPGTEIHVPIG